VSYSIKPLRKKVIGRPLRIIRREYDWVFEFTDGAVLSVATMWRMRSAKLILVTDADDRQLFGLPAPVDAEHQANEIVADAVAKSLRFDEATGDLRIAMSNRVILEILTNSGGYESWQANAGAELLAVAGNGGLR